MSNNISSLRSLETKYLADGSLTLDDATKIAKQAKTKEEKAAVREMFTHDAFASDKDRQKALGMVGVKPKDVVAVTSPMAGKTVGNTTVVRTFGPAEGYSNKFQALATARLQGADPLAVVKDPSGRWHAVQTKERLTTSDIKSAFPLAALPKPPAKNTAYETALKMPEGTDDERAAKAKALAVAGLGIPEDLVTAGRGWGNFDKEKINVDAQEKPKGLGAGRTHVHGANCGCGKNGAAIEISLSRLKDGTNFIAGTVFHEGQHKTDDDVVYGQADSKTATASDQRIKSNMSGASSGVREASAYARGFIASVGTDKAVALNQLLGMLDEERNSSFKSSLHGDLINEMKARYATMTEAEQQQFKQVVATAELYPVDKPGQAPQKKFAIWNELFGKEQKPKVSVGEIPVLDRR